MKKLRVGMAAVLILGIVALFFVVPALSQGPALPPGEYDLEAGEYVFNQHPLSVLNLSVLDLSATLVPATDTPIPPSETPVPPTDTPVPGHDDTAWHPVSEDISHTHNANPADVNHIFGPVEAWTGGQSISYPWQTFRDLGGPGNMENDFKHEGYKWAIAEFDECFIRNADTCVTAYRVSHHGLGGPLGAVTRTHSYWVEARICTSDDLSDCGIYRQGGWVSYQCLSVAPRFPVGLVHVPLPADVAGECVEGTPLSLKGPGYRHHNLIDDPSPGWTWNSNKNVNLQKDVNVGAVIAFSTFDDWQGIDPDDYARFQFICPDFQCEFNHSTRRFHGLTIRAEYINQFDPDGDGRANYNGFSDRWGNPVEGCTGIGLDCVPLVLEDVPVGKAQYGENSYGPYIDYDLSPDGEFWIEYPN